ncbi:MAG: 1-deoxy-D-xylulose-5-phosphate synthase, partial [Clostridia bacterium]|nr:1-deoxy-D-xylulose-5-phosphate synthase [Clostridia bacterium]
TFSKKYNDRFYDVGIAEEHAVTFASGLAKGGMVPVVALYSTFLQRAYDQLVHDGTLQQQKVIIGVDRAGFVGEDGVTHQGLLDVSLLNSIPNVTIYSPFTFNVMRKELRNATKNASNLTIIRYPRGGETEILSSYEITDNDFDYFNNDSSKLIISYGRVTAEVINAIEHLKATGVNISIVSLNKIKPINKDVYDIAMKHSNIYFYEEAVRSGSIGQSFADILFDRGYNGKYEHIAVDDSFVPHASVSALMKKYHLDRDSIIKKFSEK